MSRDFLSQSGDTAGGSNALTDSMRVARDRLLGWMHPIGYWEGRLSSSALATATAVSALALANEPTDTARIRCGIAWLAETQNADGGWGDTIESPSNLATTLLAIAALNLVKAAGTDFQFVRGALEKAANYLTPRVGESRRGIAEAVRHDYGEDRTFAIPILMNCGLAGLVSWDDIPGLPFELAVLPHHWYKAMRLQVVSYALPALIAIGLLIDRRHPPASIVRRLVRRAVTPQVLKKLEHIQPEQGGFLEATPLTSFVAMAMIPLFGRKQPVVAKCLRFIRQSQLTEGSWPIDTNLSVWLTTAAVTALATADELSRIDSRQTVEWIASRQYKVFHPYTHAAPGGWAWTHLGGGVPDVDDTSGAILALKALGHRDSVGAGVAWLLELQNRDGGWPTFCRGWGKLPFDRSAPDLTAHALRAIHCADLSTNTRLQRHAVRQGLQYLRRSQQADGSWIPLWFGNQGAAGQTNPVLGTSRVLRALEVLDPDGPQAACGVEYLFRSQNADGGWGGARAVASSLEETALAVAALAPWVERQETWKAFSRGVEYLVKNIVNSADEPTPIGLYFSHLWYSERLYPLIWTLEALGRARKIANPTARSQRPATRGFSVSDV